MSSIKPLPTDLRDHLAELSGNEFKVWMAYYLRTGNFDLTSHPGNETIEEDTGICNDTVKTCKASLRAKGWLTYTGDYKQPRRPGGRFAVPVMEVKVPWRPDWSAVVTDVSMAYDAITVVEKITHGTARRSSSSMPACAAADEPVRASSKHPSSAVNNIFRVASIDDQCSAPTPPRETRPQKEKTGGFRIRPSHVFSGPAGVLSEVGLAGQYENRLFRSAKLPGRGVNRCWQTPSLPVSVAWAR